MPGMGRSNGQLRVARDRFLQVLVGHCTNKACERLAKRCNLVGHCTNKACERLAKRCKWQSSHLVEEIVLKCTAALVSRQYAQGGKTRWRYFELVAHRPRGTPMWTTHVHLEGSGTGVRQIYRILRSSGLLVLHEQRSRGCVF